MAYVESVFVASAPGFSIEEALSGTELLLTLR
jgi:hypothetical protein